MNFLKVNENCYNKFYQKFVQILTKKGKKSKMEAVVINAFHNVTLKTKLSTQLLCIKLYKRLVVGFEIKAVQAKKANLRVPAIISKNRQLFLVIQLIINSIKKNKIKDSLQNKLSSELLKIVKGQSCDSLKYRASAIREALKNKSNLHFRW